MKFGLLCWCWLCKIVEWWKSSKFCVCQSKTRYCMIVCNIYTYWIFKLQLCISFSIFESEYVRIKFVMRSLLFQWEFWFELLQKCDLKLDFAAKIRFTFFENNNGYTSVAQTLKMTLKLNILQSNTIYF